MLPKRNRASKKDLEEVFKSGSFLNSKGLTLRYLSSKSSKISFIVPKTLTKSAVKRNSLRRSGYLALKKYLKVSKEPLIKGAFIYKKKEVEDLENEIKEIFSKIN